MKIFPFSLKISALDKYSDTFADVGRRMDRLGKKATKLGRNLTFGLSLPLATAGTLAVRKAAQFETLRTALDTATGSAEQAAVEFERLKEFAATTPFQLEEVVSGFIKLKNMGLDPSQEALIAYGNTAGAMGKSLDQMIEAVADAATGEFERLKEFGIKASTQGNNIEFTFRGVKTTVEKNATEIERYLRRIGEVDFAGGMEKQSNTIAGAFSNLQDSVASALDIVGTDIAKTLDLNKRVRGFSDSINSLAAGFTKLPAPVKDFAVWAGIAGIALGPVIMGIGQIAITIGVIVALMPKIIAGFAAITAAAPWLLLVGLVIGIGILFKKLVDNAGGFKNALMLLGTTIIDFVLAPLRVVAMIWSKIMGTFGLAPKWLQNFANGSNTRDLANIMANERTQKARAAISSHQETYLLQQRALQGDKAAIEVLFKNPPPGMRTNVQSETNANVTVEQGVAMEGAG